MNNIKCISLWQPWASLIAIGAKRIETRSWATAYRGPIAIHAAKKWNGELAQLCKTPPFWGHLFGAGLVTSVLNRSGEGVVKPQPWMPFGAIVAVAELKSCVPTWQGGSLCEVWLRDGIGAQERAFGDYEKGRYGWRLSNIRPLSEPFPYRGEQGLFEVDMSKFEHLLKEPI